MARRSSRRTSRTGKRWCGSGVPCPSSQLDRNDLGAAGRAPVHTVWEAAHLRVPALAGVAADGIRQPDDPLQRLEERAAEKAAAGITASRVVSEGSKLVRLTERAHEKVRLGSERVFHLVSSPIPRPYTKNYPLQTRA